MGTPAISPRMLHELQRYAKAAGVTEVILFGSRARGDNADRSDVDIAVRGGNFDQFYFDVKEKMHSLLMFDIVNLDEPVSEDLLDDIKKDGVVLFRL